MPRSIIQITVSFQHSIYPGSTYKVSQMDVTLGIKQHVIRLHVPMDDALRMDIFQSATQFGKPKTNGFFREAFAGNMESEITAIHEIHHNIASTSQHAVAADESEGKTHMYSIS